MSVSKLVNHSDGDQSQPLKQEISGHNEIDAKTDAAAQKLLSPREKKLLREWQEAYHRTFTEKASENTRLIEEYVFRDARGVDTQNRAKIEDVALFIIKNRQPIKTGQGQLKELKTKYRQSSDKQAITASPLHKGGACLAGVHEWLRTQSHRDFEGGIPSNAIYVHKIYQSHFPLYSGPSIQEATKLILAMIDDPIMEKNNIEVLKNNFGEPYVELYTIFKNLHNNNSFPNNDLFHHWNNRLTDEPRQIIFRSLYIYYSGRQLPFLVQGKQTNELDRLEFALALSGLELKEAIHEKTTALDLLKTLPSLKSGLYQLTIPARDSKGRSGLHALGLKVKDNGSVLFYDPNYRIVKSDKNEIKTMIARLLLVYSGFDVQKLEKSTKEEKLEALETMGAKFDLYRVEPNSN
ncbi:MAG: hypothetical protein WAM28_04450 [Chlamydiales bacterium]